MVSRSHGLCSFSSSDGLLCYKRAREVCVAAVCGRAKLLTQVRGAWDKI